ncbi:signal peptidase I [Microbacterium sp. LMI1-1-1.1]|uniref:signal peptidase I n=1 Tax=Microbacterium sp. LMI1-1-1.1 TaxID=3135223 RepID=UPI0034672734
MPPRRFAAGTAFAAVAVARAVLAFALGLAFWAAVPAVVGWMPTSVMSASMSPAIEVGDVVVAMPVGPEDLVPGRVLLAVDPDRPDRLRLHRLESVRADGMLVTRGDANPAADSTPVSPEAVSGVGVLRVPWVGLPSVWARTGNVVPLAVTAVVLLGCLAVGTRRGRDDDENAGEDADTPDDPGRPGEAGVPGDDNPRPTRRRDLRLAAVAVVPALLLSPAPAWASWSAGTAASGTVVARQMIPPAVVDCVDDSSGPIIVWRQDGPAVAEFAILVDGVEVARGIPGNARAASIPRDRFFFPFERSTVTVRAYLSSRWTADANGSVRIGGGFLGLGWPVCR